LISLRQTFLARLVAAQQRSLISPRVVLHNFGAEALRESFSESWCVTGFAQLWLKNTAPNQKLALAQIPSFPFMKMFQHY
jgi:hypothetical protein